MNTNFCHLFVHITDSRSIPVEGAKVSLRSEGQEMAVPAGPAAGSYALARVAPGPWTLHVSAKGFLPEERPVALPIGRHTVHVGLGKAGESYYYANGAKVFYQADADHIILRFPATMDDPTISDIVSRRKLQLAVPPAGSRSAMENAKGSLRLVQMKAEATDSLRGELLPDHPYALPLRQGPQLLGGLTADLVVAFGRQASRTEADALARSLGMVVLRSFDSLPGGYVLRAPRPDLKLLEHSRTLVESKRVAIAEPDLLLDYELDAYTPNDTLYNLQRHLPLIDADDAWELLGNYDPALRGGSPGICIAVFDPHGVHPSHPDLTANLTDGSSKLVTSFNFVAMAAQTVAGLGGDHGTQCAGSATAAFDNNRGIAGVAPNCHLIGARVSGATEVTLADAYLWAAGINNGNTSPGWPALPTRPADVISNSWGVANAPLSATMQSCFDRLTNEGRGGLGCVVTFSPGNLGYVQFSNIRRWAAYARNIAVGASINSNPTSPTNSSQPTPGGATTNITVAVDTRALYSPFGPELDIVAPSHTAYNPNLVDPITSSVRVGLGNIDGCPGAPVCNDYATSFGGTSHASPTIAGTCALILSANPLLRWSDVHDILKRTAVKIDFGQTNAIGQYVDLDGNGSLEFSQWYGYGRVSVLEAVRESLNLYVAQRVTAEQISPM